MNNWAHVTECIRVAEAVAREKCSQSRHYLFSGNFWLVKIAVWKNLANQKVRTV